MSTFGKHTTDVTLVVALASGLSRKQAAQQAKVSERTVTRRLADPAFRERVAAAQAETITQTSAQLTAAGLEAVHTLVQLLSAQAESVRLAAARAVLELAVSYREGAQLEVRIAALEAQAADQAAQVAPQMAPQSPRRGASLWPV